MNVAVAAENTTRPPGATKVARTELEIHLIAAVGTTRVVETAGAEVIITAGTFIVGTVATPVTVRRGSSSCRAGEFAGLWWAIIVADL